MKNISLRILKLLLIVDILLIVGSVIFFDINILYNTQIGFISAALVMFGSMFGYRRMVNARVEHNIITMDDSKDIIDKLDDPYDLYSEEIIEDQTVDLQDAIKEEKERMKENKRSLFQTIKDSKGAFSMYRVGAYILLVLGFLYLNRHGMLHIGAYLFSLSLPIFIVSGVLVSDKETQTIDSVE